MDVVEGLPEEFALLRREFTGITDRRFAGGLVHPLEAVLMLRQVKQMLGLMCGQGSLSAIYRFGDTHPEVLAGLGLRRSPSVATLSRLLRMVKVSEVRQAMLSFTAALSELRGVELTVAAVDGKTMRGVWEDREQLRLWRVFSRQGALALDQMRICGHLEEPRAAQEWMEQVSGSVAGFRVLTGTACTPTPICARP